MARPRCPVTLWAGNQQIGGMSGTIHDVNGDTEVDDEEDDEVDDDDVAHKGTIEMCGSAKMTKGC